MPTPVEIPLLFVSRADAAELPTPVATVSGTDYTIPSNDGNVSVLVTNDTAGALDVSFIPQATVSGATFAPMTYTIPAGHYRWIGPWPPALFNDDLGDGVVNADTGLKLNGLRW